MIRPPRKLKNAAIATAALEGLNTTVIAVTAPPVTIPAVTLVVSFELSSTYTSCGLFPCR